MFPYRRLPGHITGLYIFTVANFLVLCHIALVQGDITVISLKTNQTVDPDIPDMPAYFGAHISDDGIWGQVVYAVPANACLPIDPPPSSRSVNLPDLRWFVLIERNGCDFSRKVLTAQEAGFDAAIVHNVGSNQLEPMGPNKDTIITIPSVFIGESDGLRIKNLYTYEKGFALHMNPDFPIDLNDYLVPFSIGVGGCFLVLLLVMVVKCIRDRRQRQRHRLPASLLKKLPTKKFKKGDHDDICAICLEDYVEGEKLRVLPCSHTYHIKCIDPWLTGSRRTCPVCKRKVLPRQSRRRGSDTDAASLPPASDSSSDDDGGGARSNNRAGSDADESTPLLASASEDMSAATTTTTGRGHTNRGLDAQSEQGEGSASRSVNRLVTGYQSIPDCGDDLSAASSSGGWYQSFATPPNGSPITFYAPMHTSPGSSSSNQQQTTSSAVGGAVVDLLSSGEHSLNGDCVDFAPIEEWFEEEEGEMGSLRRQQKQRGGAGPVEIAIDVGRQVATPGGDCEAPQASTSSSSSTSSQNSQRPRRSRRHRSKDHDMVV